jgi:hypothetical protein
VIGYILDDSALIAGLAGAGSEHHRRELSRLIHGAIDGGPALDIPALCLTTATVVRPALADHLAELIAAAPPGAIGICGLTRTAHLDALRALCPQLGWPATHAAARALATGLPVLTVGADRYSKVGVDVLSL